MGWCTHCIAQVRDVIVEEHQPNGFNIGWNDGASAGQTIPHLHIHVIPRYEGDVADPRGGIRLLFPKNAKYWEGSVTGIERVSDLPHERSLVTGDTDPFLAHLIPQIDKADELSIAVAFTMRSGVELLAPQLHDLLHRGGNLVTHGGLPGAYRS